MLRPGGDGQFAFLPGSAYPGRPPSAGAAPHEGRTKVLAHNPFSTMGSCSSSASEHGTPSRSGSAAPYQRPPVPFGAAASLHTNAPPAPSAVAAASQEKQPLAHTPHLTAPSQQQQQQRQEESYQRHQQPSLSSAERLYRFPQRVAENAAAASPFTTAQGAAPPAVAEAAGAYLTPSAKVLRGASLNSLSSAASGLDRASAEPSAKRSSYLRNLLKKEPPDFLKPSPGGPVRRRSSAGPGRTPSPLDGRLSRLQANGSSQVAQGSRSGSTGTNVAGEPQHMRKQPLHDPASAPRPPTPNGGKQASSPFTRASMPVQRLNSSNYDNADANANANSSSVSIPAGTQAGLPRVLSTVAAQGPQFFSRSVGGSNTQFPSGSSGANATEKSLHGGGVEEQKLLFHSVRPQDVDACEGSAVGSEVKPHLAVKEGDTSPFAQDSRSVTSEASSAASGLDGVASPALPRKKTALPDEVPKLNLLPNNTGVVAGDLPPPPPPPRPNSRAGDFAAPFLPTSADGSGQRQELNTPRNGGMGLQMQSNPCQATPGKETAEVSPAPLRPSRQASEEVFFGAAATAPGASETTRAGGPAPRGGGDVDEPSLKTQQPTLAFRDLPTTMVRLGAAELRPAAAKAEAARFEPQQSTKITSEGPPAVASVPPPPAPPRATCSTLASLERSDVFGERAEASPDVHEPPLPAQKRPPHQRSSRKPCLALFTSTGLVVTVSNAARPGGLAVVKSERLVNVLFGRAQNVKCSKVGEEHGRTLQLLADSSSALVSGASNGVPLTTLRDVVAKMTGIAPLFREVLLFMLRDPQPDWRTEGQKYLIKLLAKEAARVPIADESCPNYPLNAEAPQNSAEDSARGLQKMQQLLCAGEREAAVGVALEHHLYAHAIIVAMMCPKKEDYMGVIRALVQQELDPFSPLAHAYCMFNELPLPPFAPAPAPPPSLSVPVAPACDANARIRSSWLQHAAVLVSNFTKESAEGLVQLGDSLVNAGMIDAAHCCFLLAHLSPMGTPPPGRPLQPKQQHLMELLRTRLGVLGGRYHPQCSRSAFVSPKSTLLTDVLQLFRSHLESRGLAATEDGGKRSPQHGIPVCPERYRAAFHYMQVLWLHEVGLGEEASRLMRELSRVVPPESKSGSAFTLNRLISGGVVPPAASAAAGAEQLAPAAGRQAAGQPMREGRVSLPVSMTLPAAKGPVGPLPDRRPTSAPPPPPPPQQQKQQAPPQPPSAPSLQPQKQTLPPSPAPPALKPGAPPIPGAPKFPPQRAASAGPVVKGPPPPFSAHPETPTATTATNAVPPVMTPAEALSGEKKHAAADAKDAEAELAASGSSQQQPKPQSRGRPAEVKGGGGKPSQRSSSLEAITNFLFRRGRSQEAKKEEAKKMIIDTAKPPKFDPVTGRYLFEETEEEKKVAEMVKAGPPKPSSMAAKSPAVGGAPPSMLRPPTGPAGTPRGGPGTLSRAQYVDMFNAA
ncbi:uncharacterized protein Tco025E_02121 [Trypanosoma conorhini]|uniref:Sec16 Sec23-binding domain-containing protein n=1 Tax=Trypanosoma conorhini TaxID=83891 RepID=A0A3R7LCI1_9TRYP|nr:uncharacterized protein Tco025E_02121 [Trypanosoma conorhini]RNF25625.1 hypothetical protein Tco025E_02121 [Trypanosoma conorhini]